MSSGRSKYTKKDKILKMSWITFCWPRSHPGQRIQIFTDTVIDWGDDWSGNCCQLCYWMHNLIRHQDPLSLQVISRFLYVCWYWHKMLIWGSAESPESSPHYCQLYLPIFILIGGGKRVLGQTFGTFWGREIQVLPSGCEVLLFHTRQLIQLAADIDVHEVYMWTNLLAEW